MQLSILVDNSTFIPTTKAENGLSIYIHTEDIRILFDTGNNALMENVRQLDVDLSQVTHIVLSHGHYDHTGGLPDIIDFFKRKKISPLPTVVSHPDAFVRRGYLLDIAIASIYLRYLHCPLTKIEVTENFPTDFSKGPVWIHPKFVFLGEIPRNPEVDEECLIGHVEREGTSVKDNIPDDSALVYKSSEGLVIICGCAHSGICNIIEYAKAICHEERIVDIIGGFHLRDASTSRLSAVNRYLTTVNPRNLHACHCTGSRRDSLPKQQNIGVGTVLTYLA